MDKNFRQFILDHSDDDTDKLLLGKGKWPEIDVPSAVNCILSRRKIKDKVPSWYACDSLFYPNTLSAEQCSSEDTARRKAGLAIALASKSDGHGSHNEAEAGNATDVKNDSEVAIADLTGGLGVDSWHFAMAGANVLYNEMDPAIFESAVHNFAELAASCDHDEPGDIRCRNFELRTDNIDSILDGFSPDVIFLDPARRSDSGSKVFRLEDCSPDLTKLVAPLLEHAPRIVAKLSPMADISMIVKQLNDTGVAVEAIHIVGAAGECKELLAVISKHSEKELEIVVSEGTSSFRFHPSEEAAARFVPVDADRDGDALSDDALEQKILFEPGKALMKSGARNLLCGEGLQKFGRSTHLYLCDKLPENLEGLGKKYLIKKACSLDKRSMKAIAAENRRCEVTARNIPMTSDELRKRMGVSSGGDAHIFGLKCDTRGNLILVCTRLR